MIFPISTSLLPLNCFFLLMIFFHPLSSRDDLTCLQADLDSINNWIKLHLLTLNTSKSKYLIFSLKPQSSFDHLPPLLISGSTLERVFSYRTDSKLYSLLDKPYQIYHQKSKHLIGLIYCNFYHYSSSATILTLYKTIVRPILEYGCSIWDPSSPSVSFSIEAVQHLR